MSSTQTMVKIYNKQTKEIKILGGAKTETETERDKRKKEITRTINGIKKMFI